ncbi:hypothetical protein BSPWISOXPB_6764 [uncultured Gammaproteobacteria bacterium]|nr:hypothetical protein BSPWISOXPB_6764 [uncultured Gammaproteobacteria bacterium]
MGDFFKPCPSRLRLGLKNRQVGEKWVLLIIPIYAKVSFNKRRKKTTPKDGFFFCAEN